MEFTGERYVPTETGEIRHEHLHRYAWCAHLAQGKDVLDIACGEGYGAAMLAARARSLVGVDIDEATIRHARSVYQQVGNLRFERGDAANIPLEDNSVDLVVSFETIEHHDRHREMLAEIRRVLRPDGLLVLSSPNRDVYSKLSGQHNEFHVKELDFSELDALLREQFNDIVYFGQRLAVGSSIFALERRLAGKVLDAFTDTGNEVAQRSASLLDPVYFVAVAGALDDESKRSLHASVLYSESEDLYLHHHEVAVWARSLDAESKQLQNTYARLVDEHEASMRWATGLDKELGALREKYGRLVNEHEAQAQWAKGLDAQLAEGAQRYETLVRESDTKLAEEAQRHEALRRESEAKLAEGAQRYGALKTESDAAIADRDALVASILQRQQKLGARAELLAGELARLQNLHAWVIGSRSWKLTAPLRLLMRILRGEWGAVGVGVAARFRRAQAIEPASSPAYLDNLIADTRTMLPRQHVEGLVLPRFYRPRVTVVIPAYGNLPATVACLRSIARAHF